MKQADHTFQTTITLLGVEREATCSYACTTTGAIVPYAVRVGDNVYPVDNWRTRLKRQAEADYRGRRVVV